MIDFILSKLGILLFAITMAGLLVYFSGAIKDVFLADETIQVSNTIAKQIKFMIESDNLCASTRVVLPKYIDIFGLSGNTSFSSIYYLLNISMSDQTTEGDRFLVFSILNKQTKKQIALESLRTKSDIVLYDFTNNSQTSAKELNIDPTAKLGQVIYMVKNKFVEDGNMKTKIYFINCGYDSTALRAQQDPFQDCYDKLDILKANVTGNYPFFCVPTQKNIDFYNQNQ